MGLPLKNFTKKKAFTPEEFNGISVCRSCVYWTKNQKAMDLSDNDIQRIVDRLRPTLVQILQNVGMLVGRFPDWGFSKPGRGTTQSSPVQTRQTSSAATKVAVLSQLFRRPSYVPKHRYATPYQRSNQRATATMTTATNSGVVALKEIILLPDPLNDNVPRGREKLTLEERGLVEN